MDNYAMTYFLETLLCQVEPALV